MSKITRRGIFGIGAAVCVSATGLIPKPAQAEPEQSVETVTLRVTVVDGGSGGKGGGPATTRQVPMTLPVKISAEMKILYGAGRFRVDVARGRETRFAEYLAAYDHKVSLYEVALEHGGTVAVMPKPRLWKRGQMVRLDLPTYELREY